MQRQCCLFESQRKLTARLAVSNTYRGQASKTQKGRARQCGGALERSPGSKQFSGLSDSFPAGMNGLSLQVVVVVGGHLRLSLVGSWHSEISKEKGLRPLSGLFPEILTLPAIPPALSMRDELQDLVQLLSAGGARTPQTGCVERTLHPSRCQRAERQKVR